MPKSTSAVRPSKPAKPHKDFPLTPHPTGRWCKKVRGKVLFFGKWEDPQGSLQKWLDQKDDLLAGRTPRVSGGGLTVADLCNRFLTFKRQHVDSGELSPRTWGEYHSTCTRLVSALGRNRLVTDLAADDFETYRAALTKTLGAVSIGNEVQKARIVFKYGYDAGLIDRPVRYGPAFKRPSKATIRKARNERGPKMFEAAEVRRLLEAADQPLRAMILLAVNCGFGNGDVAMLPLKAVDLDGGWVNYPRPKTGIERRCPLWPETVIVIREWLPSRPAPKDDVHAGLLFITKYGGCWHKRTASNPVSQEFSKVLKRLALKRKHVGFYALRHTFATIAGESKDQVAVDYLMGHAPRSDDMAAVYRERISDDRLLAVVNHVRQWLFPPAAGDVAK